MSTFNMNRSDTVLPLLKSQRSHVLFVLSEPRSTAEAPFREWYRTAYREAVLAVEGTVGVNFYERHEVDITEGRGRPLPFQYMAMHQIVVDGAEAAQDIIDRVQRLHGAQAAAQLPATWLYYPSSEKVGRAANVSSPMLTLAFANSVLGQETEFSEWYATRHIRHALNIPALVSGQCFARTRFQNWGALEPQFQTIAVYEQEGSPELFIESVKSLPSSTFHFPMLDVGPSRFAEWAYRPI